MTGIGQTIAGVGLATALVWGAVDMATIPANSGDARLEAVEALQAAQAAEISALRDEVRRDMDEIKRLLRE